MVFHMVETMVGYTNNNDDFIYVVAGIFLTKCTLPYVKIVMVVLNHAKDEPLVRSIFYEYYQSVANITKFTTAYTVDYGIHVKEGDRKQVFNY
jgi:hypothetical protein